MKPGDEPSSAPRRIQQLDVLRAAAILLVLSRHMGFWQFGQRVGWLGVQLFFVLSGYLIAGLLFAEYQRSGELDVRRFYVRRAFKIYPPFLSLWLVTILFDAIRERAVPVHAALCELFFVQNYARRLWEHTWSLAVEEHFYLLLPLLLLLLLRADGREPFRRIPAVMGAIFVVALVARVVTAARLPFDPLNRGPHLFPTHLRMDALALGVLLAYWRRFRGEELQRFVRSHTQGLCVVGASCLLPFAFVEMDDTFTHTLGFTLSAAGFGILLLLALFAGWEASAGIAECAIRLGPPGPVRAADRVAPIRERLWNGLAWIGRNSYSIYLWHLPWRDWGLAKLIQLGWLAKGSALEFVCYAAGSVLVGAAATYVIESPALRFRDQWFPSRARIRTPEVAWVAH